MPENYVVDITLPPQVPFNETSGLEQVLNGFETEAKGATILGLLLSSIINLNMQAIWGGINAV